VLLLQWLLVIFVQIVGLVRLVATAVAAAAAAAAAGVGVVVVWEMRERNLGGGQDEWVLLVVIIASSARDVPQGLYDDGGALAKVVHNALLGREPLLQLPHRASALVQGPLRRRRRRGL
jgi:hypothetical protein